MKRIARSVIPFCAALALITMSALPASAATNVPFEIDLALTLVPPNAAGAFSLSGKGTLEICHDEKVTYAASGQFTSANTDTLIETVRTASGDTLTFRCSQVAQDLGGGLLHGIDSSTIIGGTGRFAHAKGTATGETFINLNTNKVTKSIKGRISY